MSALIAGPCASWRVVRWVEGLEAEVRWCDRIEGPCPLLGTDLSRVHGVGIECAHDNEMATPAARATEEDDRG